MISAIVVARPEIEPLAASSASEELNHSTTSAPICYREGPIVIEQCKHIFLWYSTLE